MGVESTATYIDSLNESWPLSSDSFYDGYRHLQLIKGAVKRTFPNVTGEVSASHGAINYIKNVTSDIQTQLDQISASLCERLNNFANQWDDTAVAGGNNISATATVVLRCRLSGLKKGDHIHGHASVKFISGTSATASDVILNLTASSTTSARFNAAHNPTWTNVIHSHYRNPSSVNGDTNIFNCTFSDYISTGSGSVVLKLTIAHSGLTSAATFGTQESAAASFVFFKSRV